MLEAFGPGDVIAWQRRGGPKASRRRLTLPCLRVRGAGWRHGREPALAASLRSPAPPGLSTGPQLHFESTLTGTSSIPAHPGSKIQSAASLKGPVIATAAVASPPAPGVISACNAAAFRAVFTPVLATLRKEMARRRASTIGIESRRRGHSEREAARGLALDHADGLGRCLDDQAASRYRFTRPPTPDGDAARSPWRRSQAPSSPRSPARERRGSRGRPRSRRRKGTWSQRLSSRSSQE